MVELSDYPNTGQLRIYDIEAISLPIVYNRFGDHDPNGLLFVPLDQAEEVRRGQRRPIPLILRVNAGDWVEVTLYNLFDHEIPIFWNDYPSVPLDLPHPPGDPFSTTIPIQGAVSVGNVFNIEPERTQCPGDYLYRSGSLRWDVESGMRGIRYHCETACRNVKQWWEKQWYEK